MKKHLRSEFNLRQYMLSEQFELYYYDDSDFRGVENHSHDYYEIYLFLSGDITMTIEDQTHDLLYGDIIIIPPRVRHKAVCRSFHTPYRRFVLWISRDFFQTITSLSDDYEYMVSYAINHHKYIYNNSSVEVNLIHSKIFQLMEVIYSQSFARKTKIHVSLQDLLLHLNCLAYSQNEAVLPPAPASLFENLLLYIENHWEEPLSLDQLAAVFFVNKYHISHLFKKNLGLSVHQFILKKRLAHSCHYLLTECNINEIHQRIGFNDYSCFFRAFKKEYGISPKEYRDKNKSLLTAKDNV